MDTRGLTSLEEGGVKKSQWSLWEQADKISGARKYDVIIGFENEGENVQPCQEQMRRHSDEKIIVPPPPSDPMGLSSDFYLPTTGPT